MRKRNYRRQCVAADVQLSPHLAAKENTSCLLRTREKTGRNDAGVRKGSGRAVSTCVHPRYYLYLGRSSGTDVTHHLSSLFPGSVTLTESHAASDTITLPSAPSTRVVHRRRCWFTVTLFHLKIKAVTAAGYQTKSGPPLVTCSNSRLKKEFGFCKNRFFFQPKPPLYEYLRVRRTVLGKDDNPIIRFTLLNLGGSPPPTFAFCWFCDCLIGINISPCHVFGCLYYLNHTRLKMVGFVFIPLNHFWLNVSAPYVCVWPNWQDVAFLFVCFVLTMIKMDLCEKAPKDKINGENMYACVCVSV